MTVKFSKAFIQRVITKETHGIISARSLVWNSDKLCGELPKFNVSVECKLLNNEVTFQLVLTHKFSGDVFNKYFIEK